MNRSPETLTRPPLCVSTSTQAYADKNHYVTGGSGRLDTHKAAQELLKLQNDGRIAFSLMPQTAAPTQLQNPGDDPRRTEPAKDANKGTAVAPGVAWSVPAPQRVGDAPASQRVDTGNGSGVGDDTPALATTVTQLHTPNATTDVAQEATTDVAQEATTPSALTLDNLKLHDAIGASKGAHTATSGTVADKEAPMAELN